jgi:hypothetical protein
MNNLKIDIEKLTPRKSIILNEELGFSSVLNDEAALCYHRGNLLCACIIEEEKTYFKEAKSLHISKTNYLTGLSTASTLIATLNYVISKYKMNLIITRHSLNEVKALLMLIDLGAIQVGFSFKEKANVILKMPKRLTLENSPKKRIGLSQKGELIAEWLGLDEKPVNILENRKIFEKLMSSKGFKLSNIHNQKCLSKTNWVLNLETTEILILNTFKTRADYIRLMECLIKQNTQSIVCLEQDQKLKAILNLLGFVENYIDSKLSIIKFELVIR